MSDSKNNKIESIDKIIIFIIFFIFILAILGTIWWVNYKRRIEINNLINTYNRIQYSDYKYNKEDKTIHFYKDAEHISKYKCIQECFIDELQSDLVLLSSEEKITIIITTQNSSISNIYKYNKTENKFIK